MKVQDTNKSVVVNFRTPKIVKEKATKLLKSMGLDMTSALNLFLNKVLETKSIPFIITTVKGYNPEFQGLDPMKSK